jgi:arsenate reductase
MNDEKVGVLFLCHRNSCRSQMAEGFAKERAPEWMEIFSAGSDPSEVDPNAALVMNEAGIDMSGHRSKGLFEIPHERIDIVVTLCSEAELSCPTFPRDVRKYHWPLKDPAAEPESQDKVNSYRRVRDQIRSLVHTLFDWLLKGELPLTKKPDFVEDLETDGEVTVT